MKDYVYFLQNPNSGLIKIGTTRNLHTRIRDLRFETGEPLELLGYVDGDASREGDLHIQFREHHASREWFKPHDDILSFARQNSLPLNEVAPLEIRHEPSWEKLLKVLQQIPDDAICQATGCTKTTARNWKSGKTQPSGDNFVALFASSDQFADAVFEVIGRKHKDGITFTQRRKLLEVIGEA